MGHLTHYKVGNHVYIRAKPALRIGGEWCKRFGGKKRKERDFTVYQCEHSEECLELAKLITDFIVCLSDAKRVSIEHRLRVFSTIALDELRLVDPIDDEVFYHDKKRRPNFDFAYHIWWGEIPVANSLEGLLECISEYYIDWHSPIIWRGLPRIGYSLDSAIVRKYRRLAVNAPHHGEPSDALEDYIQSVERFWMDDADGRGHRYKDGKRLSDLELFALSQHQGGPTRLLDFSWNLMVALWFACFSPACRRTSGMLFGAVINHDARESITVLRSATELQRPLKEIVESNRDGLFVWQPPYINPRMYVQHSVFAFSRSQDGLVGTTNTPGIRTMEAFPDNTQFIRIGISPEFKAKMNKIWEHVYGYKPSTMFPDFEGFAQNWEYNNLVPG